MDAVIMAAGRGTRLLPLTLTRPKPLIPFLNIPLLDYILHDVKKLGMDRVLMLVDYLQHHIIKHCGDGSKYNLSIEYYSDNEPYGTAGAVKKVVNEIDDTFLVLSADILTNIDYKKFLEFHKKLGGKVTMALTYVDNPSQYGIALLDNEDRIIRFLEKPKKEEAFSNLANAGIYVLEPEIFKYVPHNTNFDFSKNLFPLMLEKKEVIRGFKFKEYWNDLGLPSTYITAVEDVLKGKVTVPTLPKYYLPQKGVISDRILITGRNCVIHGNIKVEGFAVIGDDVEIGENVRLERTVVWSNATIGDNVIIRESVIGEGCIIGSGVLIDTGSVIGDNCVIGEDSKINHHIKLWAGSRIGPGTVMIAYQ